jgi:hypothetical protein
MLSVYGTVCVQLGGSDLTVADVRKWLERVDEAQIPDDTPLQMSSLKVVLKGNFFEPVHCGDCAPKNEHIGYSIWDRDCRLDSQQ